MRQGGRTSTSIPFLPLQGSPASALVISDYGYGRGYDYFVVSVTGPKDSLAFTVMTVQGAELARLTKSHGTLHGYSADSADSAMAASRASFGAPQGPVPEISWSCFIDCLAGHVSEYCLELCEFCEDPWGCAVCAGCAGIWVGVCTWRCLF